MKARPARNPGEVTLELNRRDEPLMEAATRAVKSPLALGKILVPIDFSDCSKKALRYALPLAKEHHAAVTLLHVMPPNHGAEEYGVAEYAQMQAEMMEDARQELGRLAAEGALEGLATDPLVRVGSPEVEIVETAKSLPADLIVISTHGRTGLAHVFLGSVAEHVVRRAPCPVFVVREREHECVRGEGQ